MICRTLVSRALTSRARAMAAHMLQLSYLFALEEKRMKMIRKHNPLTEYQSLNPKVIDHLPTTTRLITDETNIRFLVEEGGFSGCSDIGICLKIGTQDEMDWSSGSLSCMKKFVYTKPSLTEAVRDYEFLHQTGSSFQYKYDVTVTYVKCSFFEEDKQIMINLLLDLAFRDKKLFEDNYRTISDTNDIFEMVRTTAFAGQGLGMPAQGAGNVLTNQQFLAFQQKYINPYNTVISMANLQDPASVISSIKEKLNNRYREYLSRPASPISSSSYVGGLGVFENDLPNFQFAMVFPGVAYSSPNYQMYHILRVLLGTSSSFSTGGPGKGMHSRCTLNLMNKHRCIDSASYVMTNYDSHGLFGLCVGGAHEDRDQLIKCTINELKKLRKPIHKEQLERAKNILISSIYNNIQRQSDRLEQLTKHIYCYGRLRIHEFEEKIKAVTSAQIVEEINRIFALKPTYVLSGNKVSLAGVDNIENTLNKLFEGH